MLFYRQKKIFQQFLGKADAGQDSALLNTKDICQKMSDQSTLEDISEEIFEEIIEEIFDRDY